MAHEEELYAPGRKKTGEGERKSRVPSLRQPGIGLGSDFLLRADAACPQEFRSGPGVDGYRTAVKRTGISARFAVSGVKNPLKSAMLHKLKNQKIVSRSVSILYVVSDFSGISAHNFKILMVFCPSDCQHSPLNYRNRECRHGQNRPRR
ncbi:MAG: hypothetical protein AAB074_02575 [Planctomycetota bacterium]